MSEALLDQLLSAMALIYLHLAITVMLFSYCLSHLDAEPKCSKFDFQEKLLEKMVRMEHSSELLKAELAIARGKIQITKTELAELKAGKPGATYIRWGRTTFPGNGSSDIYSGYAGGSFFTHKGAAASMVCLPKDPIWKRYDDATQSGDLMYGAEYDDRATSQRDSNLVGKDNYEKDVPCAVCNVKGRSSTIMIPGRSECYPGWTLIFWGYLMSGRYDLTAATNYYCVDADQEAIVGRGKNDNGYHLYSVEN